MIVNSPFEVAVNLGRKPVHSTSVLQRGQNFSVIAENSA